MTMTDLEIAREEIRNLRALVTEIQRREALAQRAAAEAIAAMRGAMRGRAAAEDAATGSP